MLRTLKQIGRVGIISEPAPESNDAWRLRDQLQAKILRILGRALCIRHVDTGSCNGCALEIHALNNPYYNIEGLGIKFVASPRHADLLLVTGPVTRNMESALRRVYDATPDPKLVIAVGDCGCANGLFCRNYAVHGRISDIVPVDVHIPGCPPAPTALLSGIATAIQVRTDFK